MSLKKKDVFPWSKTRIGVRFDILIFTFGGSLMCYEQSDCLVSWKVLLGVTCDTSEDQEAFGLYCLHGVGVGAFNVDCKLRERVGAVSLQLHEFGMKYHIVGLTLVEKLKWESLCYCSCVWVIMKIISLDQLWSYQWNGVVAGVASAVRCVRRQGEQTNQLQRLRWALSRRSASSAQVSPKDGSFGSEAGVKSCPLHYSKINCQDFWLRLVIKVKLSHRELPVLHTWHVRLTSTWCTLSRFYVEKERLGEVSEHWAAHFPAPGEEAPAWRGVQPAAAPLARPAEGQPGCAGRDTSLRCLRPSPTQPGPHRQQRERNQSWVIVRLAQLLGSCDKGHCLCFIKQTITPACSLVSCCALFQAWQYIYDLSFIPRVKGQSSGAAVLWQVHLRRPQPSSSPWQADKQGWTDTSPPSMVALPH